METIIMSKKELSRKDLLDQFFNKKITKIKLISGLRLSVRQTDRIIKKYKQGGTKALIHKNRGKISANKTPNELRAKIDDLLLTRYLDFGATFASEKLEEEYSLKVSATSVRTFQKQLGIWSPKRKRKKHRLYREPKKYYGEMAQLDGSPHKWFSWSDTYYTLLKFVDDATKQILWAEFADQESLSSVMNATTNYFKKHGKPVSIYTDRGKVFKVNTGNNIEYSKTQYQRALAECNVELIHAYSPQAKGRIERSFGTDQDRLVKEMKLANIKSIQEANDFLKTYYIPKYNSKFSRQPYYSENLHASTDKYDLDNMFCIKDKRVVQSDFTIRYENRFFQIYRTKDVFVRVRDRIYIHEHLNGSVSLWKNKQKLNFKEIKINPKRESLNIKIEREPMCRGRIIYNISDAPYESVFVCNLGHFHFK